MICYGVMCTYITTYITEGRRGRELCTIKQMYVSILDSEIPIYVRSTVQREAITSPSSSCCRVGGYGRYATI